MCCNTIKRKRAKNRTEARTILGKCEERRKLGIKTTDEHISTHSAERSTNFQILSVRGSRNWHEEINAHCHAE